VRYVPHLKKNCISVRTLEALGVEISCRDDVLKVLKGSMVMIKGIQRNNMYYLKGSMATGQVVTFIDSDDDCILL